MELNGAERDAIAAEKAISHRFIRFLLVGGLNTAVGYSVFAVLILLGSGSTLALVAATIIGIVFNFLSTGRLVFGTADMGLLPRFLVAYGAQFLVNWTALLALERAGVSPLLAQLLLLLPLAIMTFQMMKRFVFRSGPAHPLSKPLN